MNYKQMIFEQGRETERETGRGTETDREIKGERERQGDNGSETERDRERERGIQGERQRETGR